MGTINYFTSDVITLVHDSSIYDRDFIRDECLLNDSDIDPDDVTDSDIDFIIDNFINDQISDLENYVDFDAPSMEFFKLSVKYGYYEGAQLIIDDSTKYGFESTEERADALKEADTLKSVLLAVHEIGFCACFPSWCPKYYNHDETIEKIDNAINELKSRITNTAITA